MNRLWFLLIMFISLTSAKAQRPAFKDTISQFEISETDSALQSAAALNKAISQLSKLAISGFIQSQFQSAETDGIDSYAGGNFSSGMHNRFLIRRGQLKFTYNNQLTRYVFQIESNGRNINLKDAYAYIMDPWLKTFALKVGAFDRPFGFEIAYSSAKRESPERSRLFQTLFPNDADLGAGIEITPKIGFLSDVTFKGGLFAGNGINPEVDNQKDFIGRLGIHHLLLLINGELELGVSAYFGKVRRPSGKVIYTINSPSISPANASDELANRNYLGYDLEINSVLPILGNLSMRAEFISGTQPGFSTTSSSSPTASPTDNLYLRRFAGYYLIYLQNFGMTNRLVLKYDVYDPNCDVDGNQVWQVQTARLGPGDLKYSTFAIGWIYSWDANVSFMAYYDVVKNETTEYILGYDKDIRDNVFTLRLQYAF